MSTTATVDVRHHATHLRSWPQRLAHALVLAAGWILFVWGWIRVLGGTWDTRPLVILVVGSLLLLPTLTVAWILHNKRIYRIKGPRSGVPRVDESYPRDWNGRTVEADWSKLAMADLVVVEVEGDRKLYRVARVAPSEVEPAAVAGDDMQRKVA